MKRALGNLERQLFAYTQMRDLLTRLARAGMIARVRRGLYLVPPRLPLGGKWSPEEALALDTLVHDRQGRYQICGPNAFNRYGFDDQIPTRAYAYNSRISGRLRLAARPPGGDHQDRSRPARAAAHARRPG